MSDTLIIVLVIAAVAVAIALVAGYFILRFMRGSIKVDLPQTSFNPGDAITGTFTMTTKKPLEAKRLLVALVGKEVTEERRSDNSTHTHTREIFRDERTIEDAKLYAAGHSQTYEFQLTAPSIDNEGMLGTGTLGQTIQIGLELLGGDRRRLEWSVEARLDASGIDLASSKRVYINDL